jgi:hypothetical protein
VFKGEWECWLAFAQLLRAGYVSEGKAMLHLTAVGRMEFDAFKKRRPLLVGA